MNLEELLEYGKSWKEKLPAAPAKLQLDEASVISITEEIEKLQKQTGLKFWKIRRKSDGLFFGSSKWGEAFNTQGKVYTKARFAKSALSNSGINKDDLEVIEYEAVEKSVVSAEEFMS